MEEITYKIIDNSTGQTVAKDMELRTALLLIEALCNEYWKEEKNSYTVETYQEDKGEENE